MLKKRIIPCLDIKDGRTVKGINFENLVDAGDPVEQASVYARHGADEIVFLDISASQEKRKTLKELTRDVARNVNVPFTVGGGVTSIRDVAELLDSGADKISVNSSAVQRPQLIHELATEFGSQCITVAIDAKKIGNQWCVHTYGGKVPTKKTLFAWAKECQESGAGEILFTSMDHDGTKQGFAIDALGKLNKLLNIPVIASGGAGVMGHFMDVFVLGKADAALAASIFHYGEIDILELKAFLKQKGIAIR